MPVCFCLTLFLNGNDAAKREMLVCQFFELETSVFGAYSWSSNPRWTNLQRSQSRPKCWSSCCILFAGSWSRAGPTVSLSCLFISFQRLTLVRFWELNMYSQVDYLNLKNNQRLIFTSRQNVSGDKCWTSEKINPWHGSKHLPNQRWLRFIIMFIITSICKRKDVNLHIYDSDFMEVEEYYF